MKKLTELGCVFSASHTQNDIIFQKKDRVDDSPVARIRIMDDGNVLFTVKKRGVNELASQEHEVTISSSGKLEKMLLLLDQEEVVRINKTRVSAKYRDYGICVDDVENLGSFIELETMMSDMETKESEQVQEEMFDFLVSLGILPDDRVTAGYNTLLVAKKGKTSTSRE